jgi:PAS domain S-box-containing protein
MQTLWIVAIYALFGFAWIYGSDTVLGWLAPDPATLIKIAVVKGSLFICITALLLYSLIGRFVQHIIAAEKRDVESVRDYQRIFNATTEAIIVLDAQSGRIVDINDRMLDIYGYTRDEALAADIGQLSEGTSPYSQVDALLKVRKAKTEGPQVFEWLSRRKNGEIFWSEVSFNIASTDRCDKLIAVFRDIAERKMSEEALRESEERYRLLSESMLQGVVYQDAAGSVISMNPAAEQILGKSHEQFLGSSSVREEHDTIRENGEPFPGIEHPSMVALRTGQPVSAVIMGVFNPRCHEYRWVSIGAVPVFRSGESSPSEVFAVFEDITKRKHAENALKESEFFFKESQRAAQIGSYRADFTTNQWTSSEVLDTIFGITPDYDRTVQGWLDIVYPGDRDMMNHHLTDEVISKKNPFSKEYRIVRQNDGEIRWVSGLGEATFDSEGNIQSLAGTIHDITTRKNSEVDVFNFNKLLQTIINTAPVRVFWKDTELRYLGCNTAFAQDAGVAFPDDLIGMDDFQLAWHDRAEQYRADDRLVIETGIPKLSFDEQQTTPTGECMWLRTSKAPLRSEAGETIAVLGIYEDITARKQAEMALIKSEQNFRAIIDASPLPLALNDERGTITYLNKAYQQTIGYSLSEIPTIEEWWPRAYPDEVYRQLVIEKWQKHIEEARRTTSPFTPMEINVMCRDGSVRTFICSTTSLGDNFAGTYLVIFYDITDRKKVEEEKLVLEQQFQQAQKMESLGVLAGGIAHDFNNILAIIMGYCSLVKMDSTHVENHIPHIEKAAERAAGLCRQMLAYAGKAQATMTPFDLWLLADEMVDMLSATISKNVVIKLAPHAAVPFINGDTNQIRQIVMNLIINASEACGEEQGEIHISLAQRIVSVGHSDKDYFGTTIPSGTYICLEVTDNGCGMDAETKRKIFEPFYTTKFTGRGLGMSAVLGIIKTHNGAMQLVSQEGKGSTFTVYLPALSSNQNGNAMREDAIPSARWQGSGTILLAEDEEQIVIVAQAMLQKLGFVVITAANGQDALDMYRRNASGITAVVTDLGMPVMGGYTLIRELKTLNPDLPVIISSGFGDTVIASRIAPDDIAGLISKPYNFEQLREVLKKVVERTTLPPVSLRQ